VAREPKGLLVISGDHNTGFALGADVYVGGIRDFLDGLQPGFPRFPELAGVCQRSGPTNLNSESRSVKLDSAI
jgi:hypothetical protein